MLGDTLWTTDWGQRRLTLFSDTGAVLRMSTVGSESVAPTDTDPGFGMVAITMTPEGLALGWGGFYGQALAQGLIDSIPIMRSSWLGGASTTFAKYSVEHRDLLMKSARGTTYAPQPLPVYDFVIYDGPGSKACVVDRNPPATPTMVHAIVTCLAPSGDTLWQRTLAFEAMPLAPRIADSLRQREYTRWRPRGYLESDIDVTLHIPDHWPPVTEGLAGADGTIWLRGALANDSVTYTVITADGARETRVRAPRRVRILWASGTTVWAEELDDDDVPTLSRYEVVADGAQ